MRFLRLLTLILVLGLVGCGEAEAPIVTRDIVVKANRYIPGVDRLRNRQSARVVFAYGDIDVFSFDVGKCTLLPEFIDYTLPAKKLVYNDSVVYNVHEKARSEFIAKFCY